MATPSSGNGNLVEEFEESFQTCLNVLTKQENTPTAEKDEMKVEVDRFLDLARQMEAFFLQKRFFLSALKPELLVKEDNNELRLELARKDELLRRHYDKIAVWQNLLADLQGYAKSPAQGSGTSGVGPAGAITISPQVPQGLPQVPQQPPVSQMPPIPMQAQQMQQAAVVAAQQHHMAQQQQGVMPHTPQVHLHRHTVPPPAYPTHRR